MATRTAPGRVLSEAQLQELLALTKQADTVELKLTVPDANQRSAVMSLGMDPLEGQIRQVVFFDTPELALYDVGLWRVPAACRAGATTRSSSCGRSSRRR